MGNRGIVKWFNEKKGFGFITKNSGGDVFVHYSGILSDGGFRTLKEGQEVTFNLTDGQKGPQAIDVRVVA